MLRFAYCAISIAFAIFLNLSCDFGPTVNSPNHGTYFRVEPNSVTIAEGRSVILTVKTDCKIEETVYRVHWYPNPYELASIQYEGAGLEAKLNVRSPGTVYAVAQHSIFGERRDSAEVNIKAVTPRKMLILSDTIEVPVGEFRWVGATVYDSVGVYLWRPDWEYTWSLSDYNIARLGVSDRNQIQVWGKNPGEATITVTAQGLSATAYVRVQN